jgi:hypothetical protein
MIELRESLGYVIEGISVIAVTVSLDTSHVLRRIEHRIERSGPEYQYHFVNRWCRGLLAECAVSQ